MRTFRLFLLLFVVSSTGRVAAQTTNYQVYSLFVLNIAKYSSWPTADSEFSITVLGKSKVYDELAKYITKGVNGKPLKVKQVESEAEVGQPQIIYLSDGKSNALDNLLKQVQGKPVMIITEREGLVKRGADFSFFVTDTNNLRFDINATELEKRNIKISKSLSGLANSIL